MLKQQGFLTVKEASELLGVAPNTIRAWGAVGEIVEYRHPVNNYRLFKKTELENLIKRVEKSVSSKNKGKRGKKPSKPR
jgi:excisionase family DNA binding protein